MPAEAVHLSVLEDTAQSPALAPALRRMLYTNWEAVRVGALLVDFAYFDRFVEEVVRYLFDSPIRPSPWGAVFHGKGSMRVARQMLLRWRSCPDPNGAAALALGYVCHAAADTGQHPLVNLLARELSAEKGLAPSAAHREVEKHQSILFHEQRFGRDLMGTPRLGAYLTVRTDLLAEGPLARFCHEAIREALGEAPTPKEWRSFGSGYRSYIALLASPVGKLLLPDRKKAAGRSRYFQTDRFDFLDEYAASVDRSLAEVSGAFQRAIVREGTEETLLGLLPDRSIDDPWPWAKAPIRAPAATAVERPHSTPAQ